MRSEAKSRILYQLSEDDIILVKPSLESSRAHAEPVSDCGYSRFAAREAFQKHGLDPVFEWRSPVDHRAPLPEARLETVPPAFARGKKRA